jgi:predicted hydrocarbon binding protein
MTVASSPPPCFADRLVRDVERGEWRDGETRYLLLRQDSLMGMFHNLAPPARGEALAALAASVAEAGGRSAARYRETTPGGSAALLEVFAETAAQLGWGVWTFAPPTDGELCLDVANSPFAAGFGPSPVPVCAAIAGMAGTIAATVLGQPAEAEETRCVAAGAESCRFVARGRHLKQERSR